MKILTTTIAIVLSIIMMEVLTRVIIDDGLNYEIEMLKYANQLKKISNNLEIGIEHKKNISTNLMGVEVNLDENGFRYSNNTKIKDSKKIKLL